MKNITLLGFFLFAWSLVQAQEVYPDENFNQMIRDAEGGWIGADATYSIALPDGRTFWLFGDTFIGEVNEDNSVVEGAKMVRNSAIVQDGDEWMSMYNGTFEEPEDLFQSAEDTTWYWPDHGIVENDTLLIYLSKYYSDPEGEEGWNFVFASIDVARLTYPALEPIDIITLDYSVQNHVKYGVRLFEDGDYTYVYGRKEEDVNGFTIPFPHVARYPVGNWKADWEFFNGSEWSTDPMDSEKMHDYQVSQQFGVFKYFDKYVWISQDIWLSTEIFSFTSDTPYGPWGNQSVLYDTPILFDGTFTYNAWPHLQFMEDHELLVSYNSNGDFWEIFSNIEIYRPRFIRIPMEVIDPYFIDIDVPETKQATASLKLIPNPTNNHSMIHFTTDSEEEISIEIYSSTGVLIDHQEYYDTNEVQHIIRFDKSGLYHVKVIQGPQVYCEKVVVL